MSVTKFKHVFENCDELDAPEKLVLLAIAWFEHDEKGAWPSIATLSAKTGLSERGVQNAIRTLCDAARLTVEFRAGPGRANVYKSNGEKRLNGAHSAPSPVHAVHLPPGAHGAPSPRTACTLPVHTVHLTGARRAPKYTENKQGRDIEETNTPQTPPSPTAASVGADAPVPVGGSLFSAPRPDQPDIPLELIDPDLDGVQQFVDAWNEAPFANTRVITDNRRKQIKARFKEKFFREHWRDALKRISGSAFYRGELPDKKWKANLDWFLRPDTVVRLMERNEKEFESDRRNSFDRQYDADPSTWFQLPNETK